MHPIMRFYAKHCLIGFTAAGAFVAMLLWANVANLWYLVTHSDVGLLAVFLLWFFHGIVFAGVQTGIAVMAMAEDDHDDLGGGHRQAALVPVPVTSDKAKDRAF